MLPLKVRQHSLVMRISHEKIAHAALAQTLDWVELKLSRDDEVLQSMQESIGTFQFSVRAFIEFAAALTSGKSGWHGEHSYIHGNRLKLRGIAPAGLSWRKITVVRWLAPFYVHSQEVYFPGSFIQAVRSAAQELSDEPATKPASPGEA
jgi:hypothetical protein